MDLQSSLIEIISFFLNMSSSFGLGKHLINVLIQLQVESFEELLELLESLESNHFFFLNNFYFPYRKTVHFSVTHCFVQFAEHNLFNETFSSIVKYFHLTLN